MYNFLESKLKPHVEVNCPVTDGYEVENLISINGSLKSKGFLAYSAIKPPIDIIFEFICPINIYYVIIWTRVDSQQSTGLELLVKNSDFVTVNKTYSEKNGIVIFNRRFHFKYKNNVPKDFEISFFKTNIGVNVTHVEKLCVRIFRTSSSVPCLGKIEVWGNLARSCSDITRNTIQQLYNNVHCLNSFNMNAYDARNASMSKNQTQEDILNIPDEFIDPITCEIMSLPITLPCGKTIDQSTLEKHENLEMKWGRKPADPFTGLIFTTGRKPILNSSLRTRIDEFLLKNAHRKETFQLKRALGHRKQVETKQSSLLSASLLHESLPSSSSSSSFLPNQSQNLDDIIKNTFEKYRITRYTTDSVSNSNDKFCSKCNISNINSLYILLCNHYLCRLCLVNETCFVCKLCNMAFSKSDVKKYQI